MSAKARVLNHLSEKSGLPQSDPAETSILYKRENFRKAFAGFDYRKVARFGRRDLGRRLETGIGMH